MQNLGQLVSCSFFFFFYSSPDLNFHFYIFHIARFQSQKYKIFSFWEGTSPQTPPVCASMQLALTLYRIIPNVENGCTALCSFGVLAVVKYCKQCLIAMIFFFLFLYINSRLFYLSLWMMKTNLFTKFCGKLLTNKRKCINMMEFIYTLMPHDLLKII